MTSITLDAEAGLVSAELARRGISAQTRVHVVVEVLPGAPDSITHLVVQGGGFDWLDTEPDLYSDADLRQASR